MAEKKLSNHSSSELESMPSVQDDVASTERPGDNNNNNKSRNNENVNPNNFMAMKQIISKRGNASAQKKNENSQFAAELSMDDLSDASPFAMLGNYLNESRLSQLGLASIVFTSQRHGLWVAKTILGL